jgi:predicted nucleic acid-binding Zn ribbon protein
MENQFCKQCGKPVFGRSDKLFCSDYCRNTFNNEKNKNAFSFMRAVHSELSLNRRILKSYVREGRSPVRKDELAIQGFRFDLITALVKKPDKTYRCCYEYAYEIDGEFVKLLQDPGKILPYTPPNGKN